MNLAIKYCFISFVGGSEIIYSEKYVTIEMKDMLIHIADHSERNKGNKKSKIILMEKTI